MYQTILVATDGSAPASKAVDHAAQLAGALGSQLVILTATEPVQTFDEAEIGWTVPPSVYEDFTAADATAAGRILAQAEKIARQWVDSSRLVHIAGQVPYRGILQAAQEQHANLIVVAPNSRHGLDRLLLGSQTAKVLALAEVPVLVIR